MGLFGGSQDRWIWIIIIFVLIISCCDIDLFGNDCCCNDHCHNHDNDCCDPCCDQKC